MATTTTGATTRDADGHELIDCGNGQTGIILLETEHLRVLRWNGFDSGNGLFAELQGGFSADDGPVEIALGDLVPFLRSALAQAEHAQALLAA